MLTAVKYVYSCLQDGMMRERHSHTHTYDFKFDTRSPNALRLSLFRTHYHRHLNETPNDLCLMYNDLYQYLDAVFLFVLKFVCILRRHHD